MAKRTDKRPGDGAQSPSFQIPEVTASLPNPWDEIAASVPRIPVTGEVTAADVQAKPKPTYPTGTDDYDPDELQRRRANQYGPCLIMERPARSRASTLGTDLLGTCAMANELGSREPTKALISFSADRKWCFVMPVHHQTAKGVKITYQRKEAHLNFWGPFEQIARTVEKGYREYYELEMTDELVTIHGVKGFALYFSLVKYGKEPVSEGEGRGTARTKESSSTRAKSASKSSPASAATTTPAADGRANAPAETAGSPEAEADHYAAAMQELTEMLDSRDAQIEEIEAKLKAYEEKYGKL